MIQLQEVSKQIGGRVVLDRITATLRTGTIIGLQGINGSGKTMLMRVIAGLIKPTKGSVIIDGKELWKDVAMPESMGLLIENPAFLDTYTGIQNLDMLAFLSGGASARYLSSLIRKVGLDPSDKRKYKKYSLGMKQRLGIAAAIMGEPDVVLLDEPTNALDESGIEMLRKVIQEQKAREATVVLASHDRAFLESLSDEVLVFEAGKVRKTAGVDHYDSRS
ncbi:MAG: ABC transporter ATP-binding protein [Eggerthellaceae bacterium]